MNTLVRQVVLLALLACLLPACGGGGGGTLTPTAAPGIPSNVDARPGNRSAKLDWTGTVNGSSFTVLRSLNPKGPFQPVSVAGQFEAPTTYRDTHLTNGTTYYYSIVESNTYGTSAPSPAVAVTPAFKPSALSCKHGENLALLPDGSVWRWGTTPQRVEDLEEVSAVSSGETHTLALALDGAVWGWGSNQFGQLGSGVPVLTNVPVKVAGVQDAIAVAAGSYFSLALTADGRVVAWGTNDGGQLGQGTNVPVMSDTPLEVPGLTGIIAISAGSYHCLALRNDGLVFSWGTNLSGLLGNPPVGTTPVGPALVVDLTGVTKICAGRNHSMVLRNDGTVWSWGYNFAGVVGIGTTDTPIVRPAKALNLTGIIDIAAGGAHALAVRGDGTVWSWGSNIEGELGNGAHGFTVEPTPAQVPGIENALSVQASNWNSFALATDGTVYVWGKNSGLGTGAGLIFYTPVEVPNFTGPVKVAGGWNDSFLLRPNGTMWCFGTNDAGQMGNGTYSETEVSPVPAPPHLPSGAVVTSFSAGEHHVLALLSTGEVFGWGGNWYGQLGEGSYDNAYLEGVQAPTLSGITAVSCGWQYSMAVRKDASHDGTVYTWGLNDLGQLGNGSYGDFNIEPTEIPGFTGVVSVSGNERHSLAVKSDGTVWAWGHNRSYQLGLGPISTGVLPTPTQVTGMPFAVAAVAGEDCSAVLCQDGTVWSFGGNGLGPAGTPDEWGTSVPVPMPGLSGVKELVGGRSHFAALRTDGSVWAWGQGNALGNPNVGDKSVLPVQVQLPIAAVTLGSGALHTLAILTNGTVWGWGTNYRCELGNPVVLNAVSPVRITQ